jgi:RNA polymerase sigma factor (sigma-70 family)
VTHTKFSAIKGLLEQFQVPALKELAEQQVRYAPPARRLEQLARAEQLLAEVEPSRHYPYQFVCYRITEFRSNAYADLLIRGDVVEHDLCLIIEALAKTTPAVPVETIPEPVLTLEQISKRLNVSTKTITRWRDRGLVSRKVLANGRRQVGFVQSVVDRFLVLHRAHVERSGQFSQLSESEKDEIVRRAGRLARVPGSTLTEVSRRIARRLGRSPETVRYTLKNFDREHPERALFPHVTGPLDADTKQTIFSSYRRGIPVNALAKQYRRTANSVYRVINEVRAQRLLERPLEYIYHPSFDDASQEKVILAPMPDADAYEAKRRSMHAPKDVPAELASQYEWPLLNKDQEQHLFRQMNFLKYRAVGLRAKLTLPSGKVDSGHARTQDLEEIERLQQAASDVKERLISANMRLVTSIAKRHSGQTDNFFELLSDGNMSLIRAVEKFDFGRGFKFSTYASWAIMKNFARSIPEEKHRRERYVTGHEDLFEAAPDNRSDEQEALATAEQAAYRVNHLLEHLDERERQIVRLRAGLGEDGRQHTLEEIGKKMNITKERVRQLSVRIMKKLRDIAAEEHMEPLD